MEERLRFAINELPDHSGLAGAAAIKRRIERYWAERGHAVHCKLELGPSQFGTVVSVRSDMIAGLPR